ncbi:MAG TPA: hypothetical protein VHS78_04225 [Candidatus Elarobacter sp.]|jgi:hypothetical protein|nr:hypothetical protein [Candidatus Elarobacter sp.]
MDTKPRPNVFFDDLSDGEVEEFSWGSTGNPSAVDINATGVRTTGVFYGHYSFDGTTLHVTAPTSAPLPPSPIVPNDPNAALIQSLQIDTWGSSVITPPIQFAGPLEGTITFAFRQRTSVSGPIGGGSGP